MIALMHVGLGPLGQRVVRFAHERGLAYAAAADPDPSKTGRDLGDLCSLDRLDVPVSASIGEALGRCGASRPAVALVTTVSSLRKLEPQVVELARAGVPVVSTCEELVFPWITQPEAAARIDAAFRQNGVACLGTGVNPGFLMDYLPTVITGVCRTVHRITVSRIQDASVRRVPFQMKIGAGLTVEEFRRKEAEGTLRHVGLAESLDMIAHRLRWRIERKTESLAPVLAERDATGGWAPIRAGMARGVEQVARGYRDGDEAILLYFRAAVGEPESYDRIEVTGDPRLDLRFDGGVNGDTATCAIVLNAIRSVLAAAPGLRTMCDVPPIAFSEIG